MQAEDSALGEGQCESGTKNRVPRPLVRSRSVHLQEAAIRLDAEGQIQVAAQLYQLTGARAILCASEGDGSIEDLWNLFEEILAEDPGKAEPQLADLDAEIRRISHELEEDSRNLIAAWPEIREDYEGHDFTYTVRGEVKSCPS